MIFRPPQSERATAIFSDQQQLQSMLDVEAALARAEARCGVIPADAAEAIGASCKAELFDLEGMRAASTLSGNAAIPLVRQLTKLVAANSPGAEAFVHWGATSQDIVDTALVLQLREIFAVTRSALNAVCDTLAAAALKHIATPMVGRTWLQHATPTTFGLKLASALDVFLRHEERQTELAPRVLVVQLGGAAGTLASLAPHGDVVSAALAEELELGLPNVPWHSHRDRLLEVAGFYAALTVTVGKLVSDLALMMQTEVAEVAEPHQPGRGGSSSMPHKRNPVRSASILSEAARVPGLYSTLLTAGMLQQHERGLTGWQTEWSALPELCLVAQSLVESLATLLEELVVDTDAMHLNLSRTRGFLLAESVSMALAPMLGRDKAHSLLQGIVESALAESMDMATALRSNAEVMPHLSSADVDRLLDPVNYLGSAASMTQRVLDRYEACRAAGGK